MPAGKITINQGTFTQDTCTVETDLVKNMAKFPAIRNMIDYANRRSIVSLIASGGVTPYGINDLQRTNTVSAKLKGTSVGIGDNSYRFNIMGRIEKASEIIQQVGGTQADGTFQLLMRDRHLVNGMVAQFNGQRFQARVMSNPTGSDASGYTYTFKSIDGTLFVYATHVAAQSGTKTCFGVYTAYSEKSMRGYGRSKFPDTFINDMTIQRKTAAISGDAASDVLWYKFTNDDGTFSKGWMYQEVKQAQTQAVMEDERQKWFGVSSMKNADGSRATVSKLGDDPETGLPIITGDGWEQQVAGGNVVYGSATNGDWNISDLTDLMMTLEQNGDKIYGQSWVGVTGTAGYALVQSIAATLAGNQNTQFFQNVTQNGQPGGGLVDVGYEFQKLSINGNSIMFVKHPLFDDNLLFTEEDSAGRPAMSSTVFIMATGSGENKNVEILHKEANGVNRSKVTATLNGMTGDSESVISEEDAKKYAILKQDMLCVYNTQVCGILYKRAV
jgi:hypothetical protein